MQPRECTISRNGRVRNERWQPCRGAIVRATRGASRAVAAEGEEPAALAALLFAGGYGYDLRRTILEMSDGEVDADVGGLYRTLRRMEEEGSVVSRWCEEGAGPRRREYELTEQGIELAEQWIDALRSRERLDGLLASMLENGLAHLGETGSDGPQDETGAAPERKG